MEKHEQKHQETDGNPNGEPSKQVYFFTRGRKSKTNKKTLTKAPRNKWTAQWETLQTSLLFHLGQKQKGKHGHKHQETNGKPNGNSPNKFAFSLGAKKQKEKEKHDQKHQRTNGKPNGKPAAAHAPDDHRAPGTTPQPHMRGGRI